MLDPTEKEQVMKRAAVVFGVAAVIAVAPQVASAGNLEPQVVSQVAKTQVVRQALVRSAVVRPALVESALVESALVRSAALYPHKANVAQRVKIRLRR